MTIAGVPVQSKIRALNGAFLPLDADQTEYDDSNAPSLGATTVQGALDALKAVGPGGALPSSTQANAVLVRLSPGLGNEVMIPLTQDMILPSFSASLSHSPAVVECGASVATPSFTASYARTPTTAALTDTEGTPSKNVISTPNSFTSNGTFAKTAINASVTFHLTASEGGSPVVANTSITWEPKCYQGASTAPGSVDEAFIKGLSQSGLRSSRSGSFTITANAGEYVYFAFPASYGTPTFTVGVFTVTNTLVAASVPVTNTNGVTINYQVWRSNGTGLGALTWVIS